MHQYASSTPEGRELVAELEFVWNQVKANSNNTSSESSPRGGGGVDDKLGMSYASLVHQEQGQQMMVVVVEAGS